MALDNINSKVDSDEISLKELILKIRELWQFLLSKWLIILVFGMLGGVLGFYYAYFKRPVYVATTTFVLDDGSANSGGGLSNLGGIASMVGIDVGSGGGIFQGENILELYKSRTMIEKTLLTQVEYNGSKQLLIDHYLDFNKSREKWSENSTLKGIKFNDPLKFTRLQDSIIGTIVNEINMLYLNVAKPDKKLSIIKVQVSAPNEFFAKAFNDQIVKNVNDFYYQTKTKRSLSNVTILEQKADSVRAVMNGAIYAAAAVSDATPNLNPTRQIQRTAPIQRSQLSAETNKAMLSELIKNLELSRISLRKEAPLIQVVDAPIYPLEIIKTSKVKMGIIGFFVSLLIISVFLISRKFLKDLL